MASANYVYEELDERTHVYNFSDTFIGSCVAYKRDDVVLSNDRLRVCDVDMPPGMLRCFEEIISNAADNMIKAREEGWYKLPEIVVTIDDSEVSIKNGGPAIPIHKDPNRGLFVPALIFGHMRTSSHYADNERTSAGRNGFGGKLCNIFSHWFKLEIVNGNKLYTQRWEKNMTVCHDPVIVDLPKNAPDSVKITYHMDFERFGRTCYTPHDKALMARTAMEYCFSVKTPIRVNKTLYPVASAVKYLEHFKPGRPICHFVSDEVSRAKQPVLEMACVAYEGGGTYAFVNGIRTVAGGVHADSAWKRVISILTSLWPKLAPMALRANMMMAISVSVPGPIFRSQTKDFLQSPKISARDVQQQHLAAIIHDKQLETDSCMFKERIPSAEKVDVTEDDLDHANVVDAADAGTAKGASQGVLMLVEGRSARGYAEELIKMLPGGHNTYGIFELNGKLLNVHDEDRYRKNVEIQRIMTMLAVGTNGMPQRYHSLWILADSDSDGRHITLLIIYMLLKAALNMIKTGRVQIYNSPLIRVKAGGVHMNFYDQLSYDRWKTTAGRHSTMWMKGLGSSSKVDVQRDSAEIKLTKLVYDPDVQPIHALFESASDMRRDLLKANPEPFVYVEEVECWEYVQRYYPEFALASTARNVPGIDGFKRSQRQAVWAAMNKWSVNGDPSRGWLKTFNPIRMDNFTGYISERQIIHQKEEAMASIIVLMGSPYHNNYNLFYPQGQYGNIMNGMKAAAKARYLHVKPDDIFRYMFSPLDAPLYEHVIVDGQQGEPKLLLPTIPYCLINGTMGPAVGCCCIVPRFNVFQIIDWFLARLEDRPTISPKVWMRGFTGSLAIRKQTYRHRPGESDDEVEPGDSRWVEMIGKWEITARRGNEIDILVTSLPINVCVNDVIRRLKFLKEKRVIRLYQNDTTETVKIRLIGLIMRNALYERQFDKYHPANLSEIPVSLRLRRCMSLNCLYTADHIGRIQHWPEVTDWLDAFYTFRLPYYEQRKERAIVEVQANAREMDKKIKFIDAMLKMRVFNVSEADIHKKLAELDLPVSFYEEARVSQFNKENIAKKQQEKLNMEASVVTQLGKTGKDLWREDLQALRAYLQSLG